MANKYRPSVFSDLGPVYSIKRNSAEEMCTQQSALCMMNELEKRIDMRKTPSLIIEPNFRMKSLPDLPDS